jgi:hypothetical protein
MPRGQHQQNGKEEAPNEPCARPPPFAVRDELADSFPLMQGESQWLMTLLADELARIIADD